MIKLIAKLLTFYIPNSKLRKKIRTQIMSYYYGFKVYQKAEKIGKDFVVSRYSIVNNKTIIGHNVIFNGVEVSGIGHFKKLKSEEKFLQH